MAAADIASSAFPDLPAPRTPQAAHHFTTSGQLDSLVAARERDSEAGFMVRLLTLCSLPRTNPGKRTQYVRKNGPYTLVMSAIGEAGLPYGTLPRLLLAWVCTEAVRTGSRTLTLGRSLSEFMRELGMESTSGGTRGDRTRLKNQMQRLFHAAVSLSYERDGGQHSAASLVADRVSLWWDERKPDEAVLWESEIHLGEDLFNEIMAHPIPLDMNTLKAMSRSSLGLDLYLWLTYKTFRLPQPTRLSWKRLYRQFGADPARADDRNLVNGFRTKFLRELRKLKTAWPELDVEVMRGGLEIRGSHPLIEPRDARRHEG